MKEALADSACSKLAVEDKIVILPAETDKGNELAIMFLKKGRPEAYRAMRDTREAILLKMIDEEYKEGDSPLHVTVYGAGHKFIDNIVAWNWHNPDRKYSLIEVTPQALVKYFN